MVNETALKLLIAGTSLTGGAFLTAVRTRLSVSRNKTWLHWMFHGVSLMVVVCATLFSIKNPDIFKKPDWTGLVVFVLAIVFSIGLSVATKLWMAGNVYSTKQLDPVVNKFSTDADENNIKLIAGKLDFFEANGRMDKHPQYTHLRACGFHSIQILCRNPETPDDKRRYFKILHDFPVAHLRFYKPELADVKLRGRIKTLNGVTRLLIYNKVSGDRYEALELNTAENSGALYTRLWDLLWDTAHAPSEEEITEYKNAI